MRLNPELQRNVWLELTPHRLIGMPAGLFAVFFLTYLLSGSNFLESWRVLAMTIFFLLTLLWGTRLAGEALVNEVQDKTWDQQRMSSIPPWSMSWGKLFGSTVFTWYGAAYCLLVYLVSAFLTSEADIIKTFLFMVLVSVFGQAIALLASLQTVKTYHRSASTGFMVAGILVTIPLISYGLSDTGEVLWYGTYYRALDFLLVSVGCFSAWALVGIYRRIREELQFRNTPVYWLAFSIFLAVFVAGLVPSRMLGDDVTAIRLLVAYGTFIVLTYGMVVVEEKNPVVIRRIVAALQSRNWQSVFENIPAWAVNLAGSGVLCFLLLFQSPPLVQFFPAAANFKPVVIAIALFLTRDILLFIFFNMSSDRRRADATAMFYLLVLYWLVPSILNAMQLSSLNALFLPFGEHSSTMSVIAALMQAAILAYLVSKRSKKLFARNRQ